MSAPALLKKKLRGHFLKARQKLPYNAVQEKSKEILNRIDESTEFDKAKSIHVYISMEKNNEVNTLPLIKACFERGKKVIVPKIAGRGLLDHIELTSFSNLKINSWGVPEPINGDTQTISGLDLVIVPMVSGDRFKNRLGYGMGYYDRFLKECPAPKMGLLFDCQFYEKKLPVESFDIPLDVLITESQWIE